MIRSPLRGYRWVFAFLALLLAIADVVGYINASGPKKPLIMLILVPLILGLAYLAFVADDERLDQAVNVIGRFGS